MTTGYDVKLKAREGDGLHVSYINVMEDTPLLLTGLENTYLLIWMGKSISRWYTLFIYFCL